MTRRLSARERELRAVSTGPKREADFVDWGGEAVAMLVRRGLRPKKTMANVPFAEVLGEDVATKLSDWLGHYGFRLFLRGAIQKSQGFRPEETTRYLTRPQACAYADVMVDLGLAEKISSKRYVLKWGARNFGGTLEWYVARQLRCKLGFDVATGVKLQVGGVGGDLDIVAAAEGKLVYIELKSSPPKNLTAAEIAGFFDRVCLLRPDLSLFVVDTALRLSDKVVPMLLDELKGRFPGETKPKQIGSQIWALTPYIYAVNGHRDLMANIGKAIASGLRALSPLPGAWS